MHTKIILGAYNENYALICRCKAIMLVWILVPLSKIITGLTKTSTGLSRLIKCFVINVIKEMKGNIIVVTCLRFFVFVGEGIEGALVEFKLIAVFPPPIQEALLFFFLISK